MEVLALRDRNSVKLQRVETRILEKTYVKHQIVIPNSTVAKLGWNSNDDVIIQLDRKGRLILQAQEPQPKGNRMTYERFRDEIHGVLTSTPKGLTWLEICRRVPTLPVKPNALWVKRLEDEIGLTRMTETKIYRKIWKIRITNPSTLNGYTITKN